MMRLANGSAAQTVYRRPMTMTIIPNCAKGSLGATPAKMPCTGIPIVDSQTQKWPGTRDGKRRRACFRYMIPRLAFMRWYENIGRSDSSGTAA
jgi:hypothetical protein